MLKARRPHSPIHSAPLGRRRSTPATGWLAGSLLTLGCLAATGQAQTTQRVSILGAVEGNAASTRPSITPNGRYVVFQSNASNFAVDTNGVTDVFVTDVTSGSMARVNEIVSPFTEANGVSEVEGIGSISADGRYIAFSSQSTNLVSGDANGAWDVFVRDRLATGTASIARVSNASGGNAANRDSRRAWISADGTRIAFTSIATNLVAGDTNNSEDVFIAANPFVGGSSIAAITNVTASTTATDTLVTGISANGDVICYETSRRVLGADTNGVKDVYRHVVSLGTTTLESVSSAGALANAFSTGGCLSSDGQILCFNSAATNLVAGDTNGQTDTFIRDVGTGTTTRILGTNGAQPNNSAIGVPCCSPDGIRIAFATAASNILQGVGNGLIQVLVHDRTTQELGLGSFGIGIIMTANGHSTAPALSATKIVAFDSKATDLVSGDTNAADDVFTRDFMLPAGTAFCFGDGTSGNCPCTPVVNGAPGHGCPNSVWVQGALLQAQGVPQVSNDTLRLVTSFVPVSTAATFVQCDAVMSAVPFGDGLWCLSGTLVRLGTNTSVNGLVAFGYANPGDPAISVKGGVPPLVGGTYYYFVDYRNSANFCTGFTYNATNGIAVTWIP